MNDFTKEELQIISLDMITYIHTMPMLSESHQHKELREKVYSMIENYCVLEWCVYMGSDDRGVRCMKCNREL